MRNIILGLVALLVFTSSAHASTAHIRATFQRLVDNRAQLEMAYERFHEARHINKGKYHIQMREASDEIIADSWIIHLLCPDINKGSKYECNRARKMAKDTDNRVIQIWNEPEIRDWP